MIELRFHEELYDGFAVDEAVKTYAEFATAELSRDAGAYVVRVTARPEAEARGIAEATICAELSNFALGRTIERAQQQAGGGAA